MNLTGDDLQMAVRDFFTPALLLDFIDLPDHLARIRWGERQFDERERRHSVRRLEGEPDAGCLTHWSATPGGFRYAVEGPRGARSGLVSWHDVGQVVNARLSPVRYGALRAAVDAAASHDASYLPGPVPFRTTELWESVFYRPWARRSSELALKAAAALDAICPAVKAQPSLF